MSSKDHFIAQTYLKGFAGTDGKLIPYYKNKRVIVGSPKSPKSLCFRIDGDRNRYLVDSKFLREYLVLAENSWADSVNRLKNGDDAGEVRFNIAMYVAFMRMCNPTSVRIGKAQFDKVLKPLARKVAKATALKRLLDGHPDAKTILKIAEKVEVDTDADYAHAVGSTNLTAMAKQIFHSPWAVLHTTREKPLVTSDHPAVLYYPTEDSIMAFTYVALDSTCALLINLPDHEAHLSQGREWSYHAKRDTARGLTEAKVDEFNELVAKTAESCVLFGSRESWIENLVDRFRDWRMESVVMEVPILGGFITIARQLALPKPTV